MPIISHELEMDRAERKEKRLLWVIVFLIVLLVATNLGWLAYESQFESVKDFESYSVTQDAEGDANSVINGGVINGKTDN
jgi:hypothetical protein